MLYKAGMLTPDPKYPELRRRRFRPIPVRMLVPNVITLLAICAGLTAIRLSIEGRMELAVAAIVFAAVLDGVDGRVARMIKGQSKFGAELDSLADFVNFGVAPAIIVFNWAVDDLRSMGWIVVLIYAVCAALRLARFNIQGNSDKRYFIGLPSPAAAGLVAATVFYFPEGLQAKPLAWLGMVMLIVPAVLMVSTIRFQSFKTFDLGIRRGFRGLMLVAAFIAVLVAYPHELLIMIAYAYFASGFIGELMAKFTGKKPDPAEVETEGFEEDAG